MKTISRMIAAIVFLLLTPAALAAQTSIGPQGQVIVDGRPVIPLGVWQQPEYLFDYNRRLGMNCLVCPPGGGRRYRDADRAYFLAAAQHGLGCIMHYSDGAREEPPLWAWIGPFLSPRGLDRARRRVQRIRDSDRGHFIQCNVSAASILKGEDSELYREALKHTDSVVAHVWPEMLDPDNPDIRNVATFVDRVREYCEGRPGGEVSIWPDINPHKWSMKDGTTVYPAPSPRELRFQIWLALIHGADGICFFTISFAPFVYSQVPAQNEQEMMRTAELVGRFADILTAEASPLTISVRAGREDGIVDFTTRRHEGKDYVFLLNGMNQSQKVRLEAPGLGESLQLRDAIRERLLGAANGAYEEGLAGLDLRIYQLVPSGAGSSPTSSEGPEEEKRG